MESVGQDCVATHVTIVGTYFFWAGPGHAGVYAPKEAKRPTPTSRNGRMPFPLSLSASPHARRMRRDCGEATKDLTELN